MPNRRSASIDLLRLVLAIWVLFAHFVPWLELANESTTLANKTFKLLIYIFQTNYETHPAVIMFIVLSGYCINKRFSFNYESLNSAKYFKRRAYRIYPVYVLSILIGIFCFSIALNFNEFITKSLSGTQGFSLKSIIYRVVCLSSIFPGIHSKTSIGNAPLDTVAAEIWLYTFFPVIIYSINKLGIKRTFITVGSIWFSLLVYVSIKKQYIGWWHNSSFIAFLPYWYIGAISTTDTYQKFLLRNIKIIFLGLLLVSLLLLIKAIAFLPIIEIKKILFAILASYIIIKLSNYTMYNKVLLAISNTGKAGYTIYAIHAPVLYTGIVINIPSYFIILSLSVLSLLIYKIFEKPIDDLGKYKSYSEKIKPVQSPIQTT